MAQKELSLCMFLTKIYFFYHSYKKATTATNLMFQEKIQSSNLIDRSRLLKRIIIWLLNCFISLIWFKIPISTKKRIIIKPIQTKTISLSCMIPPLSFFKKTFPRHLNSLSKKLHKQQIPWQNKSSSQLLHLFIETTKTPSSRD